MSAAGRDKSDRVRIRCSSWRESNTCPDPRTFYLCTVENAVLDGLKREMKHPALAEYAKTYTEERRRLAQRVSKDRAQVERRLAAAQRALDVAVRSLIREIVSEEEAEREIVAARQERDRLTAELATAPLAEKAVELHPAALKRYERQLERLQQTLEAGIAAGDTEAAQAIRDLVESVTVTRDPNRFGGVQVEIRGRLTALLGESMYPDRIRSVVGGIDGAQGRN
jgi:site-specific DNA recombinase